MKSVSYTHLDVYKRQSYDKGHAEFLASIGVPTFACTPDKFPDLMAAALSKQDIGMWVSQNVKSE